MGSTFFLAKKPPVKIIAELNYNMQLFRMGPPEAIPLRHEHE